jgi:hypothetical protein
LKISRRQAIAIAGTTAAAVVAGGPSRATAAVAYGVTVFTTPGSGTPTVTVVGEVPAIQVTALIYAYDGSVIATLSDLLLYEGTSTNGWWRSDQRAQVPTPGVYDVGVEITAESGEIYRQVFPQAFTDLLTTRIDNLILTPARIDADHRSTTVSGDLIAIDPKTQQESAYAFKPIYVQVFSLPGDTPTSPTKQVPGATDAEGHFAIVIKPGFAVTVVATYPGYWPLADQTSAYMGLAAAVRPTRLTVAPDRTTAVFEEKIRLSGRLEWQVDGQWVPYPGQQIWLENTFDGVSPAVTDADGKYTIVTSAVALTYTVSFNNGHGNSGRDYLVASAQATTDPPIHLMYGVSVTNFQMGYQGNDKWQAYGHVDYAGPYSREMTTVHIQTASPRAPWQWKTVATLLSNGLDVFAIDISVNSTVYVRAQIDADDTFVEGLSDKTYFIEMEAPAKPAIGRPMHVPQPGLR